MHENEPKKVKHQLIQPIQPSTENLHKTLMIVYYFSNTHNTSELPDYFPSGELVSLKGLEDAQDDDSFLISVFITATVALHLGEDSSFIFLELLDSALISRRVGGIRSLNSFLHGGFRRLISGEVTSCSPSESGMMRGVAALFRRAGPSELMTMVSLDRVLGVSNSFFRDPCIASPLW